MNPPQPIERYSRFLRVTGRNTEELGTSDVDKAMVCLSAAQ
jgi:hypothetical protein